MPAARQFGRIKRGLRRPTTTTPSLFFMPPASPLPEDARTASIMQVIKHIWATRTWGDRANLLRRLQQHCVGLPPHLASMPLGWKVADFVISTGTKHSTMHNYASGLRSVLRRIGVDPMPLLDLTVSGLGVLANQAKPKQATPATKAQIQFLVVEALSLPNDPTHRLAMTIYIAWKTASRWDDSTRRATTMMLFRFNALFGVWG